MQKAITINSNDTYNDADQQEYEAATPFKIPTLMTSALNPKNTTTQQIIDDSEFTDADSDLTGNESNLLDN